MLRYYYFAAAYPRHPEMRAYRDELMAKVINSEVTSRWIDCHGGKWPETFPDTMLNETPEQCAFAAEVDLEDIQAADALVLFTGAGRGSRHVEFGYALALDKRLVVIGTREIVFHALPAVEFYLTWADFIAHDAALTPTPPDSRE